MTQWVKCEFGSQCSHKMASMAVLPCNPNPSPGGGVEGERIGSLELTGQSA